MADMYGAVRSNTFTVKDVEKFRSWLESYHFGSEIELFIRQEERHVSFGGYEQYPKDWDCPVATLDVCDHDVADLENQDD